MKIRTVAVAAVTVLALSQAALAGAAPPSSTPVTLAENLVGPLHLAVGPGKAVTVAESFAGRLTTVHRGSSATTYAADGWDVAGSEYRGSTLFFVESVGAGPMDPRPMVGALKSIDNKGAVTTITDQFTQYETAHNPDGPVQYGLSPADAAAHPDCVSQLGALELLGSYTGADVEVDTHIYGLTVEGNHAYVADAGANTVFSVNLKTTREKELFLPAVLAANVEISGSTLYATTGAFGNGALISQRL